VFYVVRDRGQEESGVLLSKSGDWSSAKLRRFLAPLPSTASPPIVAHSVNVLLEATQFTAKFWALVCPACIVQTALPDARKCRTSTSDRAFSLEGNLGYLWQCAHSRNHIEDSSSVLLLRALIAQHWQGDPQTVLQAWILRFGKAELCLKCFEAARRHAVLASSSPSSSSTSSSSSSVSSSPSSSCTPSSSSVSEPLHSIPETVTLSSSLLPTRCPLPATVVQAALGLGPHPLARSSDTSS